MAIKLKRVFTYFVLILLMLSGGAQPARAMECRDFFSRLRGLFGRGLKNLEQLKAEERARAFRKVEGGAQQSGKANPSADVQTAEIARLTQVGFQRIGSSPYLRSKEFTLRVEPDGSVQVFPDEARKIDVFAVRVRSNSSGGQFVEYGARIFNEVTGDRIQFLGRGRNAGSSFEMYPVSELEKFRGRPAASILKEAGFEEIPGSTALFVLSIGEDQFIGYVPEDGAPVLSVHVEEEFRGVFPKGLRILGVKMGESRYGDREEQLILGDENREVAIGASLDSGQSRILRDLAEIEFESAQPEPGFRRLDPATGFVYGGTNSTTVIRRQRALNGIPVPRLEAVMRPGASSRAGFLLANQSLIEVLAADNDYVVGKMGLTHQILAEPLKRFAALFREGWLEGDLEENVVVYRGRKYLVSGGATMGYQESPFNDGTRSDTDITIVDEATGESLELSILAIDMIDRYGFYEGPGTPYRVDPARVIQLFQLDSSR